MGYYLVCKVRNRYNVTFPSRDSVVRNAWILFRREAIDTSTYTNAQYAKDTSIKMVKQVRLSCGSSHFYDEEVKHTVLGAITKMKDQYRRQKFRKFLGEQSADAAQIMLPLCLPNCALHYPQCLDGSRPTPLFDLSKLSAALNIEVEFNTVDKCVTNSGVAGLGASVEVIFEELVCSDALKAQVRSQIPRKWPVMSYSEKTATTSNASETIVNLDELVASYHTRCFYLSAGPVSDYDTNLDIFRNANCVEPKSLFVDINGIEVFEFEEDEEKHTEWREFIENSKPEQPDLEGSKEEPYILSFSADGGYSIGKYGNLAPGLSSHMQLRIKTAGASDRFICIAEHERVVEVKPNGSVHIKN